MSKIIELKTSVVPPKTQPTAEELKQIEAIRRFSMKFGKKVDDIERRTADRKKNAS